VIAIAAVIAASVAAGVWSEGRRPQASRRLAHSGLTLMLYVLVPFIIFFNTVNLEVTTDVAGGLGLAIVVLAAVGVIAWRLARGPLGLDRPGTGAVIASTLQVNTGYLGLPVAVALLGSGVLSEAAAYDALVSGPVLFVGVFAVGAAFGSTAGETLRERTAAFFLRNPPLVAVVAAWLAPAWLAPAVLVDASHVLVFALVPICFFAVGVILASDADEGAAAFPPPLSPPIMTVLVLRLAVAPALLLLLAAPLIDLPEAYLLQAAMATGITTLVVAHAYGLTMRIVAGAIAWSTAIVLVVGIVAGDVVPLVG
jgi:hypothetical protein